MFNTTWGYPSIFRFIPTYFHACDEPVSVIAHDQRSYIRAEVHLKAQLVEEYWKELSTYSHIFCPIGDHHGSQRLIEAAYAGAIPILIGDPLMTSVPACIRGFVLSLPAKVDIIAQEIYGYQIPDDLIYRSDDPSILEPGVTPSWVYNPDPRATLDLPVPLFDYTVAHMKTFPNEHLLYAAASLLNPLNLAAYIKYELAYRKDRQP
jgi:hypothetical protein